jgi:hypothetical protein
VAAKSPEEDLGITFFGWLLAEGAALGAAEEEELPKFIMSGTASVVVGVFADEVPTKSIRDSVGSSCTTGAGAGTGAGFGDTGAVEAAAAAAAAAGEGEGGAGGVAAETGLAAGLAAGFGGAGGALGAVFVVACGAGAGLAGAAPLLLGALSE